MVRPKGKQFDAIMILKVSQRLKDELAKEGQEVGLELASYVRFLLETRRKKPLVKREELPPVDLKEIHKKYHPRG